LEIEKFVLFEKAQRSDRRESVKPRQNLAAQRWALCPLRFIEVGLKNTKKPTTDYPRKFITTDRYTNST